MKLYYDVLLSSFAFNFNLQPYRVAAECAGAAAAEREGAARAEADAAAAAAEECAAATARYADIEAILAGGSLRTSTQLTLNLLLLLRASMDMYPEGMLCSDLGRALVLNDPPVWPRSVGPPPPPSSVPPSKWMTRRNPRNASDWPRRGGASCSPC